MDGSWHWIYLIGAIILLSRLDLVTGCSWSNEGCSEDKECCSNSCHRAHEGTNPRCRHSMLGERCVFNYHCQDTLICGPHFNCCSPYWKICNEDSDCCDPYHVCRPASGFYYDRCLYPSAASFISVNPHLTTATSFFMAMFALGWMLLSDWMFGDG